MSRMASFTSSFSTTSTNRRRAWEGHGRGNAVGFQVRLRQQALGVYHRGFYTSSQHEL
ncbi:hypothetical protein JZ751_019518 [Albula glossodonta]|uniref:Uncharacterized protein n=1 Tax=Albula glossodonta TaxID=121402 RepID=A0A8T2MTA6_9TELE|nr:hypothetical protein JZ751_019518 [Albula glossodonta]